jgi:hypothetical protein
MTKKEGRGEGGVCVCVYISPRCSCAREPTKLSRPSKAPPIIALRSWTLFHKDRVGLRLALVDMLPYYGTGLEVKSTWDGNFSVAQHMKERPRSAAAGVGAQLVK